MPVPRSRRRSTFAEIAAAIAGCERGQERNLYPYVRDLFTNVLGYRPGDLLVDTADESGGIPDLAVLAPNGLTDGSGVALTTRWLVLEVKDEPGVFHRPASRERIFREKAKYIGLDTAWFVLIDPECFVLRPVTSRAASYDPARDTVLLWDGLTEAAYKEACREIHAENSAINPRLEAFRRGEEAHIAEVKLTQAGADDAALAESRAEFYTALRTSAELIKLASLRALETFAIRAREVRAEFDAFFAEFGRGEFHLDPFRLSGEQDRIPNREAFNRHRDAILRLRKLVRRHPAEARLGCFTQPEYEARALGKTAEEKSCNAVALLASETASLLVARCLMLRFFEDHGFFGARKYLCNGGIAAFQVWRAHYRSSYTWFLRESFGEAARIAAALFEEGHLDWVLTCADPQLSTAIERALFYLSRFDFATVEQDVLSGVYGQFLDNTQRKEYGEHYTPPEVARFIVRHLPLHAGDRVLDPACGLGTFLIEAWKALIGDLATRGAATWDEALATLDAVRGNDLNSFSATIAQLQLLWHLFTFREQLQQHGLPEPAITGGHDSLHAPHTGGALFTGEIDEFALFDTAGYGAVVGNPPYVRPERQTTALQPAAVAYFDEEYSARSNLCGLFLYKALDYWLRPEHSHPGCADSGHPARNADEQAGSPLAAQAGSLCSATAPAPPPPRPPRLRHPALHGRQRRQRETARLLPPRDRPLDGAGNRRSRTHQPAALRRGCGLHDPPRRTPRAAARRDRAPARGRRTLRALHRGRDGPRPFRSRSRALHRAALRRSLQPGWPLAHPAHARAQSHSGSLRRRDFRGHRAALLGGEKQARQNHRVVADPAGGARRVAMGRGDDDSPRCGLSWAETFRDERRLRDFERRKHHRMSDRRRAGGAKH